MLQSAFLENVLAQLQTRQPSHGEDQRKNPETDDDLVFMPALKLKMVVDG